ncbi:MAG TPA: DUF4333 domain-containing protein [Solirubrobacterales bacterium]|nr:DUF4333 domain-containing protein [Solirubrobacterales bacterium]
MRLTAAIITACAALGVAACGGDEEVTLPSTTAPTATGATGATGEDGATGTGAAVEDAFGDAGFGIQSVSCPDDVPLEEGDTFECDFTVDSGEAGTLSITVDSADEQSAMLSYEGEAGSEPIEGEGIEVEK